MSITSGSKVHRFVACPASAALPQVVQVNSSEASIRGRTVHRFLERAREAGRDIALVEAPEKIRAFLAMIDLDELPAGLAAEVSFAWDWKARTGREIGRGLDRQYGELGPTEIPLTVDLLGLDRARGRVYVGDYKTGFTRYPRPSRFGQTLLGACAATATYGAEDAIVELIYLDRDGDAWHERDSVDQWTLETFADELQYAAELHAHYAGELAAGRGVQLREGDHCEHCPAFKACPAKIALVRSLVHGSAVDAAKAPGYLAPERLAETYRRVRTLRDMLAAVETEIHALAFHNPIDLGDGEVLGPIETVREKLVGPVAASVLTNLYGAKAAEEASKISVSKEALRQAIAKRAKPKQKLSTKAGDGLVDLALKEIRARNGVEWTRSTTVKPHRPKGGRLPAGEDD